MIVLDTSVLYALLDADDAEHQAAIRWQKTLDESAVTTPLIVAELDYLARVHAGLPALRSFRRDLAAGVYAVRWWDSAPEEIVSVADRYADLGVSLADASLVALAAREGTNRIATLDERHFRAMRPLDRSDAFVLLPADADA